MYNRKDSYYKKAKSEGYKSRAAYKLMELNKKYSLIKKGYNVLDVGAAPGGWCQVSLELVGDKGKVVGVDLLDIDGIENKNFYFIKGDLKNKNTLDKVLNFCNKFDTIISDAAPNTSGQKFADHLRSMELVELIFDFTIKVLKPNGNFLFKLFDGADRENFIKKLKQNFSMVKIFKPDSTRKNSFEIYIICKGFKSE
jgi:23S rRNA (uridine2552-2'-O)-methyltransferase